MKNEATCPLCHGRPIKPTTLLVDRDGQRASRFGLVARLVRYDAKILDGATTSDPVIRQFCGIGCGLGDDYFTTSNVGLVFFNSQPVPYPYSGRAGFQVKYEAGE